MKATVALIRIEPDRSMQCGSFQYDGRSELGCKFQLRTHVHENAELKRNQGLL